MNKKILVLLGFVFLLCGCSSEVNLTLSEDTIMENITITFFEDGRLTKEQIKTSFREYIPLDKEVIVPDLQPDEPQKGVSYYERKMTDIGSGYQFVYSNKWSLNNYKRAKSVNAAFKSFSILKDTKEGTITYSTDSNGILLFEHYPNLESVKINIRTENEVVEANVSPINGVYSWDFYPNKENNIYLVLKMKDKSKEEDIKNKPSSIESPVQTKKNGILEFINSHPILVAIVTIGIFFLGMFFINKITMKKYQ